MNTSNDDLSFSTGVERKADAAINGLLSHMPAGVTQLTVGGVTYQVADLVKVAREHVQPWKDIRAARAVERQVLQARPEDDPKLRKFLADLKYALSCVLGRDSEQLRNFGIAPSRRAKDLTAEEILARAEKAKLTRELRRQKAAAKNRRPETGTVA